MNHWFVSYMFDKGFGECRISSSEENFPITSSREYISKEFCNGKKVVIINFIKVTEEQYLTEDENENKSE